MQGNRGATEMDTMTAPATRRAAESVRKAAAAALEALPAILLAAALLMPALAAFSAHKGEQPVPAVTGLGQVIAAQGNQALIDIRAESRASLRRDITLPQLP